MAEVSAKLDDYTDRAAKAEQQIEFLIKVRFISRYLFIPNMYQGFTAS